MKYIVTLFILVLIVILSADLVATPEFALWTGNKCSVCHVNNQGGSQRKQFGWAFGKDGSLFSLEDISSKIDTKNWDNTFSRGLFSLGTDFRFQTTRSFKTENATRKYFPMQASLYGSFDPKSWLTLTGQYNFGKIMFAGQKEWSAYLIFKPADDLPMLRIGYFQPSIGIRECDMTSLNRRVAASDGTEVLIATDFAEYGVEMNYESLDWLSFDLGIFDSKSLYEVTIFGDQLSLIMKNNPSGTMRFVLYPGKMLDFLPDSYLGSSVLVNGNFIYSTAFAGFNITQDVQIYGQMATSNKPFVRHSLNYIAGVNYMPYRGLFFGVRAEHGKTNTILSADNIIPFVTDQYVINSRIFILPFIELIPEYRIIDAKEYRANRWTVQLHLYY